MGVAKERIDVLIGGCGDARFLISTLLDAAQRLQVLTFLPGDTCQDMPAPNLVPDSMLHCQQLKQRMSCIFVATIQPSS